VEAAFKGIYADVPHALVSVSDRDVSFDLEGDRVIELLEAGSPRNLAKIPVGEGRRTVFDGVTVVFVRVSDHKVRLDAWRSFVPHVTTLLNRVNQEMAIGL
jgi:sarcosine oxidase subunit gamma